ELNAELQVKSLNLEQKQMQLAQGGGGSEGAEATQVVTDDQFIEVIQGDESEAGAQRSLGAEEATSLIAGPYGDAGADQFHPFEPTQVVVTRVDAVGVAQHFDEGAASHIRVIDGRVLAQA